MASDNSVQSVVRVIDIIKAVSEAPEGVTAISKKLDLHIATVYRLLKTAEKAGLVVKEPVSRKYYLGSRIFNIASTPTDNHQNLIMCALEDMRDLWKESEENVVLSIKYGNNRLHLLEFHSIYGLKYTIGQWALRPLNVGAPGKVLLSELTSKERKLILENMDIIPMTSHTITDKEQLMKQLEDISIQGYATDFGETVVGGIGISVPIKNYMTPAALSILGIESRMLSNMGALIKEMKVRVERISNRLSAYSHII